MTKEVMIRFFVGEKGSRKAVAEVWTSRVVYKALIEEIFSAHKLLTLAQVVDECCWFIAQYERTVV